jgi:hypothetical protein
MLIYGPSCDILDIVCCPKLGVQNVSEAASASNTVWFFDLGLSVASKVARLRAELSAVSIPKGARDFSLFQNVRTI